MIKMIVFTINMVLEMIKIKLKSEKRYESYPGFGYLSILCVTLKNGALTDLKGLR